MNHIYTPVVRASAGSYRGAALVGTYSIIIGWTLDDPDLREGLQGFAIKRLDISQKDDEVMHLQWLGGYKRFEATDTGKIEDISSLEGPFQRFRWNDYSLKPHLSYRYEVYPMRGTPENLVRDQNPLIFEITPSKEMENGLGVYVNRGVTSSMAYLSRFQNNPPKDIGQAAYQWLSRGLKESLLNFINDAKSGEKLHCAIYEFHDLEVGQAFKNAIARGVDVKIIHDAKPGKHSTEKTEKVIHALNLESVMIKRDTVNISHNKVVIHLDNQGTPKRVWTGSANFSENAFNFQTNASLVVNDISVAQNYEDFFQILRKNPTKKDTKISNKLLMDTLNLSSPRYAEKTFFSPISKKEILTTACDLIKSATSMVLISAPFGLDKSMIEALASNDDSILEYGVVNSVAKRKIEKLRQKNTRFFPPNRLETYMGRSWDAKAFGAHKIHSKIIIIDPYSEHPKVFFGSANFSKASCSDNDENALLIKDDKRLTAIMTTEFMRMYDHYKARYYIDRNTKYNKEVKRKNKLRVLHGEAPLPYKEIPKHLIPTSKWSKTTFIQSPFSHKFQDRIAFSGTN